MGERGGVAAMENFPQKPFFWTLPFDKWNYCLEQRRDGQSFLCFHLLSIFAATTPPANTSLRPLRGSGGGIGRKQVGNLRNKSRSWREKKGGGLHKY